MPQTHIVLYIEENATVAILDWLRGLTPRARAKCIARILRLKELGYQLRRPEADLLRDGIYELRVSLQHVQYRILYFYHGQTTAVLSHGVVKGSKVPAQEIDVAIIRKKRYEANSFRHTFVMEF